MITKTRKFAILALGLSIGLLPGLEAGAEADESPPPSATDPNVPWQDARLLEIGRAHV